ncbi:MAG: hypothetical protein JOY59_12895 [Candidatus Eremiobacteraeota bacterium]|nr:hypothetical protein [Candidatus Eremiobacteraeota bacterium]
MTPRLRKVFAPTWIPLAFALALTAGFALPALAQSLVRVHIPLGIRTGFTIVEPAADPAHKYVVIEEVVIPNPTGTVAAYKVTDFSLVVGDVRYHPVARAGMGAIDIARDGVLGPHDAIRGDLAFLVPENATRGDLEFLPANWIGRHGESSGYCCLP